MFPKKIKGIDLKETITKGPEKIDFVFEGFKTNTIGFLTAKGSTGKGMIALQLSATLADTTKNLDFLGLCNHKRGKIGFLSIEDDNVVLTNRFFNLIKYFKARNIEEKTINSIYENLDIVSLHGMMVNLFGTSENFTSEYNEQWCNWLRGYAKDKFLIIIDTLSKIHCADENSNSSMSNLLRVFENIIKDTGTTILFLHHSNKASYANEKEQSSSRGASSLIDNARFHLTLNEMSSKEKLKRKLIGGQKIVELCFTKVNYSKPEKNKILHQNDFGFFEALDKSENKINKSQNIKALKDEIKPPTIDENSYKEIIVEEREYFDPDTKFSTDGWENNVLDEF